MGIRFFVNRNATKRRHFTLYDPVTGTPEEHYLDLAEELSDVQWLDIQNAAMTRAEMADDGVGIGMVQLDMSGSTLATRTAWIKGWSLTNAAGAPVKPTRAILSDLAPDIASIIDGIVAAHAEEAAAIRHADRDPKPLREEPSPAAATRLADSATAKASPSTPASDGSGLPSTEQDD